jgi:ATP:ADP antiporter, AAA family
MTTNLSKLLYIVFPVEKHEMRKFLPMSLMLMLIIFIYSILRGAKDTILIPVLGAEIISAVKLWGVFPSAVLFMIIYTKLANILSRENIFYALAIFFLSYFAAYALFLSPMHDQLKLDLSDWKEKMRPLRYVIIMIENWSPSLFYILAELWGSVMLSLMFWQFANQITPVHEAKRFYSLFGLIGQVGLITAGFALTYFSSVLAHSEASQADAWGETLIWLIGAVTVAGVVLMYIYWWMNRYVLSDKRYYDPELISSTSKNKKKKVKLSIMESLKYVFTSKYIGLIALLVISYGVSINLVEGVWKSRMQEMFPVRNDYSSYMGYVQIFTGVGTIVGMVIGVNILRRFSWFVGAIITPIMIAVTGLLFFVFIMMNDSLTAMLTLIGTTALSMSVFMGAAQNVLSKSIKYSLFDATKEMSYIPLDDELKMKGKAAVDVVGARFGKSGGAIVQFVLIAMTGLGLPSLTNEIFIVFAIILLLWIYAVFALSKEFNKVTTDVTSGDK